MIKTTLVMGMLLASGIACAQQSGFYMGGSIGQAWANIDDDAASFVADIGGTNVSGNTDDTDITYKIFGGFKVNQNFAVEGGYAYLGKYTTSADGTFAGGAVSAKGNVKSYAIFLDAVGILPANEQFSVFGKAGFAYTNTDAHVSASTTALSASDSASANKWVPKLGLGAQFQVSRNIALRAEYEYYFNVGDQNKTGESDVQILTAGISFGF